MTEQTMTPDEVLEVLDADIERQRMGVAAGHCDPDAMAEFEDARTAVAALIARNAELEAERNEWKLAAWKARDERDAETTRANAMRENAERYLWLRNESICYPYSVTKASPWCVYGPDSDAYPSRPIDREELDAAVDAARAEAGHG